MTAPVTAAMPQAFIDEVALHLRAGYPLIFVVTADETSAFHGVQAAAQAANKSVLRPREACDVLPLRELLGAVTPSGAVVVLDDVHRRLDDPDVVRLLADAGRFGGASANTLLVLTPSFDMPKELESHAAVCVFPYPTAAELGQILSRVCVDCGVLLTDADQRTMVRVGQGLTASEAARAFHKALLGWPEDADAAGQSVAQDKRRMLRRSNVLAHIDVSLNLDDLGGLDQLKRWLLSRKEAFSARAEAFGLPAPKGLLLMGVQGCGKSLSAKCVAGYWHLPLVRLDLSAVYGQASPESALREALRMAEAMAPVVLWIDEIEKGFDNTGAGASSRLLGGLITWLQEKQKEVFVVATANRVEFLPPELPRKGRFDEIFFVDLPDAHERRAIWTLHLQKRGIDPDTLDIDALVQRTDRMTGSEIEQLVIAAMFLAFERGEALNAVHLLRARTETVSLYETFEPEIKKLREWARKRARPASADRSKIDYFAK